MLLLCFFFVFWLVPWERVDPIVVDEAAARKG